MRQNSSFYFCNWLCQQYAGKFKNIALFLRFGLPSTLIRHENRALRKRSSNREEVKPWSQGWLIPAGTYPGFCSMKRLEVFLLPQDGMSVHRRSLPRNLLGFLNNLPVPIYTPGWREAL